MPSYRSRCGRGTFTDVFVMNEQTGEIDIRKVPFHARRSK